MREKYGLPHSSKEEIQLYVGTGLPRLIGHFYEKPVADSSIEAITQEYRNLYKETTRPEGTAYPGVEETLRSLMKVPNLKLGICTNRSSGIAEWILSRALPEIPFEIYGGSDSVSEKKPSPKHLTELITKVGLEPENVWYLGDHPVDQEAAQGAGVNFVACSYGFGDISPQGEVQIQSFSEILKKIPFLA